MLRELGFDSLESMTAAVVPADIRLKQPLNLPAPLPEQDALSKLRKILAANKPAKSLIGQGYFGAYMPAVSSAMCTRTRVGTRHIHRTSRK